MEDTTATEEVTTMLADPAITATRDIAVVMDTLLRVEHIVVVDILVEVDLMARRMGVAAVPADMAAAGEMVDIVS